MAAKTFDPTPDYPGGAKITAMRKDDKPRALVKAIQLRLVAAGCFDKDDVDARWDLKTKRAIKCLQKKKGLTADGIPGPVTWEKAFGWKVPFQGSGNKDYPYVWFRPGVNVPPNKDYMRKLNAVGREGYEKHGRRLVMVSGYRPCGSPSDAVGASTQWGLWQLYQAGRGNLAARPCTSNHGRGYAADIGWEGKSGGGYMSYLHAGGWARDLAKRHGLCFPVPGEAWHCEPGTRFAV